MFTKDKLPGVVVLIFSAYQIDRDKIEDIHVLVNYCNSRDAVAVLEFLEKECLRGNGDSQTEKNDGLFDRSLETLSFLGSADRW